MARNQERNFGSDWRSDRNDRNERNDRENRGGRSEYGTNSYDRESRFPEDYEQRNFGGNRDRDFNRNRDYEQDREFGSNRFDRNSRMDDHHRGAFGDRDYNRDYNLGTGTSMRMNRYESSQGQDRGFFGKGPKGWKRSDDKIKEEVCESLYDSRMIDASEIEVTVKDGHVTLSGTVDSRDAKREAESLIDSVRGVEDVTNNIKLSRSQNVSDLSNRRTGTDSGKSASLS